MASNKMSRKSVLLKKRVKIGKNSAITAEKGVVAVNYECFSCNRRRKRMAAM